MPHCINWELCCRPRGSYFRLVRPTYQWWQKIVEFKGGEAHTKRMGGKSSKAATKTYQEKHTHLVMWAFNAKQIILQVTSTLCQLQQLLVIINGAVKVGHDRTGDVRTTCLKYVQDFEWSSLTSSGMDDERGTCICGGVVACVWSKWGRRQNKDGSCSCHISSLCHHCCTLTSI